MSLGSVISGCPDSLRHTMVLIPTTSGSSELPSTLVERICQNIHGLEGVFLLADTFLVSTLSLES